VGLVNSTGCEKRPNTPLKDPCQPTLQSSLKASPGCVCDRWMIDNPIPLGQTQGRFKCLSVVRPDSGPIQMPISCSGVTVAGLSLMLDGKELWKRDAIHVGSTKTSDPYWVYEIQVTRPR